MRLSAGPSKQLSSPGGLGGLGWSSTLVSQLSSPAGPGEQLSSSAGLGGLDCASTLVGLHRDHVSFKVLDGHSTEASGPKG